MRAATSPAQSARRAPSDGTTRRPLRPASLRPDNCCGRRALDRSGARPRASGIAATADEPMKRVSFNAVMAPAPKRTAASRRRLHSVSAIDASPAMRSRGAAPGIDPNLSHPAVSYRAAKVHRALLSVASEIGIRGTRFLGPTYVRHPKESPTEPFGVRLGMSIDEVDKLNTSPLDYRAWMAHSPRGCSLILMLEARSCGH
jgi:HrpA-like RNA helicase